MTRLTRCRFVLAETIADPRDRLNDVRALGEFLAERAHDHVDDVARDVGIVTPNVAEDLPINRVSRAHFATKRFTPSCEGRACAARSQVRFARACSVR